MRKSNNIFVISLGGSLVCPDAIDIAFLKRFHRFIHAEIKTGKKFIIIVGGGQVARLFQAAAGKIVKVSDEDKDWIGIHATRLNAHLLRTIFKTHAKSVILKRRKKVASFDGKQIIVGAGWHPGWSTDFVAVQTAIDFGIDTVINLGSAEYVYDKDNKKYKNAKPFKTLSWQEYMNYIPSRWKPGIHAPVDPVASRLSMRHKIKVVVAGGKNLENVKKILLNKSFNGTIVG